MASPTFFFLSRRLRYLERLTVQRRARRLVTLPSARTWLGTIELRGGVIGRGIILRVTGGPKTRNPGRTSQRSRSAPSIVGIVRIRCSTGTWHPVRIRVGIERRTSVVRLLIGWRHVVPLGLVRIVVPIASLRIDRGMLSGLILVRERISGICIRGIRIGWQGTVGITVLIANVWVLG